MSKSAEELFAAALELTNPAERVALLDRECVGNPALRVEVESLLAAHEQASKFLENPPAAAVAETLAITTGMVPVTEKPGDKIGRYNIDTRSDIYSLGVLFYELLTGRTPFDATELLKAGLDEMRRIIREKEPSRPSTRLAR